MIEYKKDDIIKEIDAECPKCGIKEWSLIDHWKSNERLPRWKREKIESQSIMFKFLCKKCGTSTHAKWYVDKDTQYKIID